MPRHCLCLFLLAGQAMSLQMSQYELFRDTLMTSFSETQVLWQHGSPRDAWSQAGVGAAPPRALPRDPKPLQLLKRGPPDLDLRKIWTKGGAAAFI